MALVQASCVFNLEFVKFFNLDLFHQGLYQVRAFLRPDSGQHARGVPLCHVQSPELIASRPPDDPAAVYETAQVVCSSVSTNTGGTNTSSSTSKSLDSRSSLSVSSNDIPGSGVRENVQFSACSKTLHVQYTDQAEWLGDTFRQRVTWQCEVQRVSSSVVRSPLHLTVQLYWMSTKNSSLTDSVFDTPNMKLASERTFVVHYHPDRGLHHHFHVLFNYQNLCAVEMQLHGVLCDISPCHFILGRVPSPLSQSTNNRFGTSNDLHISQSPSGGSVSLTSSPRQKNGVISSSSSQQPIKSNNNSINKGGSPIVIGSSADLYTQERHFIYKSWHSILFNVRNQAGPRHAASEIHFELCRLLLSAHECLLNTFCDLAEKLPLGMKIDLERKDCRYKFQMLTHALLQVMGSEEDLADLVTVHISKLASENVALFDQFTETFSGQRHAVLDLLRVRSHWKRMRRFAEGFFTRDYPLYCLISLYDRGAGYESIAQTVRQSEYFTNLAPLQMECPELDGEASTLPLIFEDVYTPTDDHNTSQTTPSASTPLSNFSSPSNEPPLVNTSPANATSDTDSSRKDTPSSSLESTDASTNRNAVAKERRKSNSALDSLLSRISPNTSGSAQYPALLRAKLVENSSSVLADQRKTPRSGLAKGSSAKHRDYAKDKVSSGIALIGYRKVLEQPPQLDLPLASSSSPSPITANDAATPTKVVNSSPISSGNVSSKQPSKPSQSQPVMSPTNSQVTTISLGTLAFPNPPETLLSRDTAKRGVYSSARPIENFDKPERTTISTPLSEAPPGAVMHKQPKRKGKLAISRKNREQKSNNSLSRSHLIAQSMPNLVATDSHSSISSIEQEIVRNPKSKSFSSSKRKRFNNLKALKGYYYTDYPTATELLDKAMNMGAPNNLTDRAVFLQECNDHMDLVHTYSLPSRTAHSMWDLAATNPSFPFSSTVSIGSASSSSSIDEVDNYDEDKTPMPYFASDQSSKGDSTIANCFDKPVEDPNNKKQLGKSPSQLPNTGRKTSVSVCDPCTNGDSERRMTFLELLQSETSSQRNSVRKTSVTPTHGSAQLTSRRKTSAQLPIHRDKEKLTNLNSPAHRYSASYNTSPLIEETSIRAWPEAAVMKLSDKTKGSSESSSASSNNEPLANGTSSASLYTGDEASTTPGCFGQSLVPQISRDQVVFVKWKEELKEHLAEQYNYHGQMCSDLGASHAFSALRPYFSDNVLPSVSQDKVHLIVCVHGLEGNESDLRLAKVYLQLALCQPACGDSGRWDFLMSSLNRGEITFAEMDILRENLVKEINCHILSKGYDPYRISFIGHSMGAVLVRAALTSPGFQQWIPRLHTFLSLSGPHLGTIYNRSGLVNLGLWLMRRVKKGAGSLQQLSLMDRGTDDGTGSTQDLRKTYMYKLSMQPGLGLFSYVLLVSSPQDRYVPYHSSRIELCREAVRANSELGRVYTEMVGNVWRNVINSPRKTKVVRYDVYHALSGPGGSSSTNRWIGRAAHIAVLDSELFLEKLMGVSVAKYFSSTS